MKWNIPVQRTVAGVAEVEAQTLAEAMVAAQSAGKLIGERSIGDAEVVGDEGFIRTRYNHYQADAKNGLIPFDVEINKYRYATVIVWAKDRKAAMSAVDKMIDAADERIVYEDGEAEIVDAYEASEDLIEKYPNVWVEEKTK